jgi:hypothetical protein
VISICVGLFFRLFGSALPIETVEDTSAGTVSNMTPNTQLIEDTQPNELDKASF